MQSPYSLFGPGERAGEGDTYKLQGTAARMRGYAEKQYKPTRRCKPTLNLSSIRSRCRTLTSPARLWLPRPKRSRWCLAATAAGSRR